MEFEGDDLKADFLAREQAAMKELGEDLFGESVSPTLPNASEPVNSDSFGFNPPEPINTGIKSPVQISPASDKSGFTVPVVQSVASPKVAMVSPAVASKSPTGHNVIASPSESESLRKWKVDFEKRIQERDAANAEKHKEILAQAKLDIDKFYADYEKVKAQKSTMNKYGSINLQGRRATFVLCAVWSR